MCFLFHCPRYQDKVVQLHRALNCDGIKCNRMMNNKTDIAKVAVLLLLASASFPASYAADKTDSPVSGNKVTPSAQTSSGKAVDKVTEKSNAMTKAQMIRHLRAANDVAKDMKKFGHHPFGAVLVAPDNEQVLMHQGNVSVVRHAETELSRRAAETYTPEYLANCTLVTTMEPCVMCAGNVYFANIGSVLFGAPESTLRKLTGTSKANPTMNLPCKQVFDAGQKSIRVLGPIAEMEDELSEPHKGFW